MSYCKIYWLPSFSSDVILIQCLLVQHIFITNPLTRTRAMKRKDELVGSDSMQQIPALVQSTWKESNDSSSSVDGAGTPFLHTCVFVKIYI